MLKSAGLTERQFSELMTVPHTFFYLRVRKDSVLDTKASTQQLKRRKSTDNASLNKSTTQLSLKNRDNGSDESKNSTQEMSKGNLNLDSRQSLQTYGQGQKGSSESKKPESAMFNSRSTGTLNSFAKNQVPLTSRNNASDFLIKPWDTQSVTGTKHDTNEGNGGKQLAWSGKIPVRGIPPKKLLSSKSALSINSLVSEKGQLLRTMGAVKPPMGVIYTNIDDDENIPESTLNRWEYD
jgi:hypothetical protein